MTAVVGQNMEKYSQWLSPEQIFSGNGHIIFVTEDQELKRGAANLFLRTTSDVMKNIPSYQ